MANEESTQSGAPAKQIRVKPSLTTALVMSFGALILFGMVLVQGISMWSAQKNTRELLSDKARFAVLSLLRESRRRLAPVKQLNEYMSGMIDSGQIDIDDHAALSEALLTGIAGTDQVFGIAFVYPNGTALRVLRGRGALPLEAIQGDIETAGALTEAQQKFQSFWGRPVWLPRTKQTIISVRTPIREGDVFKGLLVSGVTVNALSRFIAQSGALPLADNRFILYGKDHVLAHRLM